MKKLRIALLVLFIAIFSQNVFAQEVPVTVINWSYDQMAATMSTAQINHEWATVCSAMIAMNTARPGFYWADDYRRVAACNLAGISFTNEDEILLSAAAGDNKQVFNAISNTGILRLRAKAVIGLIVEAGLEAREMLEVAEWSNEEQNALHYLVFQMMAGQQITNDMRGGGATNFPIERIYHANEIEVYGRAWVEETSSYDSRYELAYWLYRQGEAEDALEIVRELEAEFGPSDSLFGTQIQYLGGTSSYNSEVETMFEEWEVFAPCSDGLLNWQIGRRWQGEEQWRAAEQYVLRKIEDCGLTFERQVRLIDIRSQNGMPGTISIEEKLSVLIDLAHENASDPRYWWWAASEALNQHTELPISARLQDETFIQLSLQGDMTYRANLDQ